MYLAGYLDVGAVDSAYAIRQQRTQLKCPGLVRQASAGKREVDHLVLQLLDHGVCEAPYGSYRGGLRECCA